MRTIPLLLVLALAGCDAEIDLDGASPTSPEPLSTGFAWATGVGQVEVIPNGGSDFQDNAADRTRYRARVDQVLRLATEQKTAREIAMLRLDGFRLIIVAPNNRDSGRYDGDGAGQAWVSSTDDWFDILLRHWSLSGST
jgi:hypothetical protein